jgi:hypothetical protein
MPSKTSRKVSISIASFWSEGFNERLFLFFSLQLRKTPRATMQLRHLHPLNDPEDVGGRAAGHEEAGEEGR